MNKVIAVEENLTFIKNYLHEQGCEIVDVEEMDYKDVDAVVIYGTDESIINMGTVVTTVPLIIDAQGKSPEEIWSTIVDSAL